MSCSGGGHPLFCGNEKDHVNDAEGHGWFEGLFHLCVGHDPHVRELGPLGVVSRSVPVLQ